MSDTDLALFWNNLNCQRWAQAIQVETESGLALCDTDPLKLHYDYCLARIGASSWPRFDAGVDTAAEAILSCSMGIADLMLVNIPDDETLTQQRDSDLTRRRRNFDLHRRLGAGLRDWYSTLATLDPGRVRWEHPRSMPCSVERDRYDADLFDDWMAQLPRPTASE